MANTELMVGMAAPEFPGLKELLGKIVVLYFYPKDFTLGCTQESCDFRDAYAEIQKVGGVVFGVSKDTAESHQKFREKYTLPFSLLSDPDGKMTDAYGCRRERATFVIDHDGIIRRIWKKVNVKRHVEEVAYFVQLLQGQRTSGLLRASITASTPAAKCGH